MRTHKDRKHVSFYTLTEIKMALKRAVLHFLAIAPEDALDETGRYENSHHIEAAVCWLVTQPQETQDAIILAGRKIALKLRALPEPAKDFPAAYRPASVVPVGGGHDRGRDTIGRATTVPELTARLAGKPARGPRGKKKRPETNGSPAGGIG